ncbi:MAG TPA: prepilin peptidase [Patescibacteria group bacterium]|nr:prepilin peptidase [Patescibacteria group bacterium]
MIIAILAILGLAFGSFVNALVWRLHEQNKSKSKKLSILYGHSMCPNCKHQLAIKDLVPVFSWVFLRGKCRYCKKPISKQYPLVELLVVVLFVVSYVAWPINLNSNWQYLNFATWLVILVGLTALAVYDNKWMILPDKIIYPVIVFAIISTMLQFALGRPGKDITEVLLSVIIGGGLFWLIYQVSLGKWIGGGDVKLGFLLGILVAKPELALLLLFFSSILGLVWILPLMISKKITRTSKVPFGPFLIMAAMIVVLFGQHVINWYQSFILVS